MGFFEDVNKLFTNPQKAFDDLATSVIRPLFQPLTDAFTSIGEGIGDYYEWALSSTVGKVFVKFRKGQLQNYKIVGLKDGVLAIRAVGADGTIYNKERGGAPTSGLVVTTFDTTEYPRGAILKLENSVQDMIIESVSIAGKAVVYLSNQSGYSTDYINDLNSQYEDGVKELIVENRYIANQQQIKDLADWYWKDIGVGTSKKHYYVLAFPGKRFDLKIGQRYTLDIGEPGDVEFFEADCQLIDIKITGGTNYGSTACTFREYQRVIPAIIDPSVRLFASGSPALVARGGAIRVVAAGDYPGDADYLCDGVDDHIQIQAAIDELASIGGGTVTLTEGTYKLGGDIYIYGDVKTAGKGRATKFDSNNVIRISNKDGSITNGVVSGIEFIYSGGTRTNPLIYGVSNPDIGTIRSEVQDVYILADQDISNGVIWFIDKIDGIRIEDITTTGTSVNYIIANNVNDLTANNITCDEFRFIDADIVKNVTIDNVTTTGISSVVLGVTVQVSDVSISNVVSGLFRGITPTSTANIYNVSITNCSGSSGTSIGVFQGNTINSVIITNLTSSGGLARGIQNCSQVTICTVTGVTDGSGSGIGFSGCLSMQQNKSTGNDVNYTACYASAVVNITYTVADTPNGGFNS